MPKYFPELRIRKYFGVVFFVSPSDGSNFDDSQTPQEGSIVTLSLNNRKWGRLQAAIICRHPPLSSLQPEANIILESLKSNKRSTYTRKNQIK